MIAFALLNWRWLLPALISVVLLTTVGIQHVRIADLEATLARTSLDIEKNKTQAANLIAASERRVAEAVQANAELSQKLEVQHAKDLQQAESGRADFDAQLNQRVRELAQCRNGSANRLPAAADHPADAQGPAESGGGGLRNIDPASARALRTDVLELQAAFKECFATVQAWGR